MILEEINGKLKETENNVFYGLAKTSVQDTLSRYIVFQSVRRVYNPNKTSFSDRFAVHLVSEKWVDKEWIKEVTKNVLTISGMVVAGDGEYVQIHKGKTDTILEMYSIEFAKTEKVM